MSSDGEALVRIMSDCMKESTWNKVQYWLRVDLMGEVLGISKARSRKFGCRCQTISASLRDMNR